MNHVKKLKKNQFFVTKSKLNLMDMSVQSNLAWKGSITFVEGQSILCDEAPFTYILSKGLDKYHYLLHYVGSDHKVYIKNVRIKYINNTPVFRNGGGAICNSIDDLIHLCLKCSQTVCKPLKK